MANAVLFLHAAFVAFVASGLLAVWLGAALGWRWVRNRRFRLLHFAAIAFVALEALAGVTCPLTRWEDALRGATRPDGFVADWISRLLYWNLPPWVFIALYCGWTVLTMLAWRWIPPRAPEKMRGAATPRP
jgi:hypothetical protein